MSPGSGKKKMQDDQLIMILFQTILSSILTFIAVAFRFFYALLTNSDAGAARQAFGDTTIAKNVSAHFCTREMNIYEIFPTEINSENVKYI